MAWSASFRGGSLQEPRVPDTLSDEGDDPLSSPKQNTPKSGDRRRSLGRSASLRDEGDCPSLLLPIYQPPKNGLTGHGSTYLLLFESLLFLALLYTLSVTPFELATLWHSSEWGIAAPLANRLGWLFVCNRLVDAVFLIDVIRQASTAFFDDSTNTMCSNRLRIVARYAGSGEMLLDLIAVFPLDLLKRPARDQLAVVVLRVLRLLKLRRASTLLLSSMIRDSLKLQSGHLRLVTYLGMTIVLSHMMACGYILVASFQTRQTFVCNWVSFYFNVLQSGGGICEPPPQSPTLSSLYLVAIVWSMETITTVGYGEVIATTDAEHAYIYCSMIVGGAFFSYVVGNFVTVMQELQAQHTLANRRLDTLNTFADSVDMDAALASRLRRYLRSQDTSGHDSLSTHTLLSLFPPSMRLDIAKGTRARAFSELPMLSAAPLLLLIELSISFKPVSIPTGEEMCRAGTDARRCPVLLLRRGLIRCVDPSRDKELYPRGHFLSPAITPDAAKELIIGEEVLWSIAFPHSDGIALLGATYSAVTTAHCLSIPAHALSALISHFPELIPAMRVPVRARWLCRRFISLRGGVRRIRALPDPGHTSFSGLLAAACGEAGMKSHRKLRHADRVSLLRTSMAEESLDPQPMQLNMALAVFIVQCAARKRFEELTAGALRLQAVFRGKKARAWVKQRRAQLAKWAVINRKAEAILALRGGNGRR